MTPSEPELECEPELEQSVYCAATGKVQHPSRRRAVENLNRFRHKVRLRNKSTGTMCVFLCRSCQCWHVGNQYKNYERDQARLAGRPRPTPPDPVMPDDEEMWDVKVSRELEAKILELAGVNPCEGLSESAFQAQVVKQAKDNGWAAYHTHDSRRSEKGFPDLVLVRTGELIFAELKVGSNRTTAAQDGWLALLGSVSGVRVFLWYETDWPEIRETLERR